MIDCNCKSIDTGEDCNDADDDDVVDDDDCEDEDEDADGKVANEDEADCC